MHSMNVFLTCSKLLICLCTYLVLVTARDNQDLPNPANVVFPKSLTDDSSTVKGRYIIQFSRPPSASLTAQRRESASPQDLERKAQTEQEMFDAYCRENQVQVQVKRKFLKLFNGVSVKVDNPHDLSKIANAPGVKSVFPVVIQELYNVIPRNTEQSENSHLDVVTPQYVHSLTNVNQVHQTYPDLTGVNVKVGVIDTGIDWKHSAFAEPGKTCDTFKGPGCRVRYGSDFVGNNYDPSVDDVPSKAPIPDDDPMDCDGHGSHVAGIIGGYDGVHIKGVAPQVTLGAYKIFGCNGGTDNVQVLTALEAAYQDGMEIVNLSLGGGHVGTDSPYSQAVDILAENGVYVIAAASNSGREGLFRVSAPAVASKAISVASYDNIYMSETLAKVNGAKNINQFGFGYFEDVDAKFDKKIQYGIIPSPADARESIGDACEEYSVPVFANGVALIRRGGCTFTQKVVNAQKAGATGVIIYNNESGKLRSGALDVEQIGSIPVAFIDKADGDLLREASVVEGASVLIQFNGEEVMVEYESSGKPSDFSSWGLDINLLIQPDVGAPGGNIYSSYPRAKGSYKVLSGTSMASPYVAGVVALDIQKNGPSLGSSSTHSLMSRLSITANPAYLNENQTLAESVAKVGGGLIDAMEFLNNQISVTPHKLELGDSPCWPKCSPRIETITIRNDGNENITYQLNHISSRSVLVDYDPPASSLSFNDFHSNVIFSDNSITLLPGETKSIMVTIDTTLPPDVIELIGEGHWIMSGYIALQSQLQVKKNLTIPYALMVGDFSTLPVLDQNERAPVLTNGWSLVGLGGFAPKYDASMPTPVFSLDTSNLAEVPVFGLSTHFPTRMITMGIHDASQDTHPLVGYLLEEQFVSRIKGAYLPLVGKIIKSIGDEEVSVLPDGHYVVTIQLVKPTALIPVSDPEKALTIVWTSPSFIIDRKKYAHVLAEPESPSKEEEATDPAITEENEESPEGKL